MKRLFPAPWLSLALWVLWLVLNLSISPGNLLLGALLGFLAPLMIGVVTDITGNQQLGISPLIGLFLIGLILLLWVKPQGDRSVG